MKYYTEPKENGLVVTKFGETVDVGKPLMDVEKER